MNWGRLLGWAGVALLVLVPINWIALRNQPGASLTGVSLALSALLAWTLAGAGGYALVRTAQRRQRVLAERRQQIADAREAPLLEVRPSVARLKPNERAFVAVAAELKALKTVGFRAGTSGLSVRVAKGVTVRTAGTRGGAIRQVVTVARGELVVTDQRVIFAGDSKSLSLPLGRIVNVTYYDDGVGVNDERASHAFAIADAVDVARVHGVAAQVLGASAAATDEGDRAA